MDAGRRCLASRHVRGSVVALTALLPALLPTSALAHGDVPTGAHDLWRLWSLEPLVAIPLALAAWAYFSGKAVLRQRRGSARSAPGWRAGAFAFGLLGIVVALISPLDSLADALFSAHMIQHLLLVVVAPALLVLSRPLAPMLWSLPLEWRRWLGGRWRRAAWLRGCWRALTMPAVAWAAHVLAIWAWHLPGPYQSAVEHGAIHAIEHATFLATAFLYWWTVLGRAPRRTGPAAVLSLFAMGLQSSALGALLTFSEKPWYPVYETTVSAWGLSPMSDQQLAGLIMWIPAGAVYLAAALAVFGRWLAESEQEADRRGQPTGRLQREGGA